MRLTIYDNRSLGAALLLPKTGDWWDWTAAAWSWSFDAARSLRLLQPVPNPDPAKWSVFTSILTVDLGSTLIEDPYSLLVIWSLGPTGLPLRPVPLAELKFPGALHGTTSK